MRPELVQTSPWLDLFGRPEGGRILADLDGVLHPDYPHASEEGGFEAAYQHFLQECLPLLVPGVPLYGIVTGRLEKHREATLAWLLLHGVWHPQLRLTLMPAVSQDERRSQGTGSWKGLVYAQDDQATLFVESKPGQAREIARASGKAVLCWTTQEYYPCLL